MEPIPQANLTAILLDAREAARADEERAVRGQLQGLLGQAHTAARQIVQLEQNLAKKQGELAKLMERLTKIENGDWAAVPTPSAASDKAEKQTAGE